MSIIELGALGEFLGSIGVIATLIYLAIQVRQTQRAVNANTYQALSDTSVSLFALSASTDGIAHAMTKLADEEQLDPIETYRAQNLYRATLRNVENWHYQWEQGLLPGDKIEALAGAMSGWPAMGIWWEEEKPKLRPSFVAWVESKVVSSVAANAP